MTIIIHKSDVDKIVETHRKDKIHLFLQFFIPNNNHRKNELRQSLFYNVSNPCISLQVLQAL